MLLTILATVAVAAGLVGSRGLPRLRVARIAAACVPFVVPEPLRFLAASGLI